jgi:hypothetical protein
MATSPNYAWAEPDNSSLVKNGAQDIRALGDAIDTSLWNVGYGQAGKNKIINGDFDIWQRGTTFTDPAGSSYFADRFRTSYDGTAPTTRTYSQQTFTSGTAPVAGYEGRFFSRTAITTKGSNTNSGVAQLIENVRTFAGQTVTLSFWAKCDTARTGLIKIAQVFGTGGSPSATVTVANTAVSYTSSWARYTLTVAIPSISGKTLGTNNDSYLSCDLLHTSADGSTFDVWGVQMEYGSKATPFQTATGTLQGELAACQRYYYRTGVGSANNTTYGVGMASSTTAAQIYLQYPVTMRVLPSSIDYADLAVSDLVNYTIVLSTLALSDRNNIGGKFVATVASGLSQYRPTFLINNTNVTGYLGFSAEL